MGQRAHAHTRTHARTHARSPPVDKLVPERLMRHASHCGAGAWFITDMCEPGPLSPPPPPHVLAANGCLHCLTVAQSVEIAESGVGI